MQHFHELETEKFYLAAQRQAVKQIQNRRAFRDLLTFVFGLAVIAVGAYAIREMPNWLPATVEFLEVMAIRWS